MKDELQSKMVEILTSIQAATGKASDFALTQLPDVAQSYILYGRVSVLISLFAWLVALIISLVWLRHEWRKMGSSHYDGRDDVILAGPTVLVITLVFFSNLNHAALVWFAPKVWLLKELAGLIK